MTIRRILGGFAIAVALLLGAGAAFAVGPDHVVIGNVNQSTGQAWLQKHLLRKQFADGGQIAYLRVRQYLGGYDLLRIGKSVDGSCRTESIPMTLSGNRLVASSVAWLTVCSSPSCSGFCAPNASRSACDCSSLESLESGSSDQIDDYDAEHASPTSGHTNCNFGMDVSGMGLSTVIIH